MSRYDHKIETSVDCQKVWILNLQKLEPIKWELRIYEEKYKTAYVYVEELLFSFTFYLRFSDP